MVDDIGRAVADDIRSLLTFFGTLPDGTTTASVLLPAAALFSLSPVPTSHGTIVKGAAFVVAGSKTMPAVAFISMIFGAVVIWHRQLDRRLSQESAPTFAIDDKDENSIVHLVATSLLVSGIGYFIVMGLGSDCPCIVHYLFNLGAMPLWMLSLGRARRQDWSGLLNNLTFYILGAAGQAVAGVAGTNGLRWGLLIPCAICRVIAACEISEGVSSTHLQSLSEPQRRRLHICGNALALYIILEVLVQGLGVAHEIGEDQQMFELALLDTLVKLPACHLLTKERWIHLQPLPSRDADVFTAVQPKPHTCSGALEQHVSDLPEEQQIPPAEQRQDEPNMSDKLWQLLFGFVQVITHQSCGFSSRERCCNPKRQDRRPCPVSSFDFLGDVRDARDCKAEGAMAAASSGTNRGTSSRPQPAASDSHSSCETHRPDPALCRARMHHGRSTFGLAGAVVSSAVPSHVLEPTHLGSIDDLD